MFLGIVRLSVLCNIESSSAVAAPDCLSDALGLQDTSAVDSHDLSPADQYSKPPSLPGSSSHPPAVIKKRGRGRPPIYNLSDKRKAQLKEVCLSMFLCRYTCTASVKKYLKIPVCFVIYMTPCSATSL